MIIMMWWWWWWWWLILSIQNVNCKYTHKTRLISLMDVSTMRYIEWNARVINLFYLLSSSSLLLLFCDRAPKWVDISFICIRKFGYSRHTVLAYVYHIPQMSCQAITKMLADELIAFFGCVHGIFDGWMRVRTPTHTYVRMNWTYTVCELTGKKAHLYTMD